MIELVRLRRAFNFWKRLPDNPVAIERVIKQYLVVGYMLRPRFNPEIDAVVESIVHVKEKDVNLKDRLEAIALLEEIADSLSKKLLHYVLIKIVQTKIGREILAKLNINMFEFAWMVATFDYSFSSKHIVYTESTEIGDYVMALSGNKSTCILSEGDKYYLITQSKNGMNIKRMRENEVDETIRNLNITETFYI